MLPSQGQGLLFTTNWGGPQKYHASDPSGPLKKAWCPHTPTLSDSVGLGWSLRICISSKFQGTAAGLRATPYTTRLFPLPGLGTPQGGGPGGPRTSFPTAFPWPCPPASASRSAGKTPNKPSQATPVHTHLSPPRRPPAFIIKTILFSA